MTRGIFCERILRQIYGGMPTDDAEITVNLISSYLDDAIGAAAKQNYIESIKLDGVSYVNNSFYSTFKGLSISSDSSENFLYSMVLPQVPVGLGKNEGISSIRFNKLGDVSKTAIPLSQNQWAYRDTFKRIPNKIVYCNDGDVVKFDTTIQLFTYTANVIMISAGLSSDLTATIHVPADYFSAIVSYVRDQLVFERKMVTEEVNDGKEQKPQ